MMEGFGIHTFRLINAKGKSPELRQVSLETDEGRAFDLVWDESQKISGARMPTIHRRDHVRIHRAPAIILEWELGRADRCR